MVTRDLTNNIKVEQAISPGLHTATPDSAVIDLAGYESATAVINVGTYTDGTYTFAVQESDTTDSNDFADVDNDELDGTEPVIDAAGEDEDAATIHQIGYKGFKRYLRVLCTVTDTPSTGMEFGAVVIKGDAHSRPVE